MEVTGYRLGTLTLKSGNDQVEISVFATPVESFH